MKKHLYFLVAAALLLTLFCMDWAKAMLSVYAFMLVLLGCAAVFAVYTFAKKTNP